MSKILNFEFDLTFELWILDFYNIMRFDIITIFPKIFSSYFSKTILARAQKNKLIDIRIHDLRKYADKNDAHKSIDDRPYGGGPGMILKIEPIYKALRALKMIPLTRPSANARGTLSRKWRGSDLFPPSPLAGEGTWVRGKTRVIMLTPSGKRFTQRDAERLSQYDRLVLLCGRYEGFDARVDKLVDEKISIGDFVLAGGELPAMILVETISRHIPGVVGHKDALAEETFSKNLQYKEYPQYTRPAEFYPVVTSDKRQVTRRRRGWRVPRVLLSGNHKKIKEWQEKRSQ